MGICRWDQSLRLMEQSDTTPRNKNMQCLISTGNVAELRRMNINGENWSSGISLNGFSEMWVSGFVP